MFSYDQRSKYADLLNRCIPHECLHLRKRDLMYFKELAHRLIPLLIHGLIQCEK